MCRNENKIFDQLPESSHRTKHYLSLKINTSHAITAEGVNRSFSARTFSGSFDVFLKFFFFGHCGRSNVREAFEEFRQTHLAFQRSSSLHSWPVSEAGQVAFAQILNQLFTATQTCISSPSTRLPK